MNNINSTSFFTLVKLLQRQSFLREYLILSIRI